MSAQHPIFQQYPIQQNKVHTSAGDQPTPYHVYDAHAILIGGTADYARVKDMLRSEQVTPAQTQSGRALMALWAVDETAASHGAHTEMQVSFYVTPQPVPPVRDGAFALLNFLLNVSGASQMCHGLWNNTREVVAYNREILGLSPRLAHSSFRFESGRAQFQFTDAESGALLSRGDVRMMARQPMDGASALFRSFGFLPALRAMSVKTPVTYVTNPMSDIMPRNARAYTIGASDAMIAQLFDAQQDKVELYAEGYNALDFQPTFIEHMRGFKLVYLNPQ